MGKTDYSRVNHDLTKLAEKRNKTFVKVEWMKIPFGDTTFMVLPPFGESSVPYEEVMVHFGFKDDKGHLRAYKCSKPKYGKCPICDLVAELKANDEGKKAGEKEAKKMFLYNVADIDLKNKVAPFKPSQHKEILMEMGAQNADEGIDITDPLEGKQIKLSRLKADPWARARVLGKKVNITTEQADNLLKGMADLSKVYVDNTPEELEKMLNGEEINQEVAAARDEEDEETDVEEVETPTPAVEEKKTAPKVEEKKSTPKAESKKEEKKAEAVNNSELPPELAELLGE